MGAVQQETGRVCDAQLRSGFSLLRRVIAAASLLGRSRGFLGQSRSVSECGPGGTVECCSSAWPLTLEPIKSLAISSHNRKSPSFIKAKWIRPHQNILVWVGIHGGVVSRAATWRSLGQLEPSRTEKVGGEAGQGGVVCWQRVS